MQYKEWQKPITTRRYLHAPLAERVATLWSEGKIVLGEVETLEGPRMPEYETLVSCGVWPVFGKEMESLDFKKTENIMMKNGIPVHSLKNSYGKMEFYIEAFCNLNRKSTVFFKVALKNTSNDSIEEKIGFLLRTGFEKKLVFDAPDVYKSYAPDVDVWKNIDATWKRIGNEYRDEEYFLWSETDFDFNEQKGLIYKDIELNPGEEIVFEFTLGKGISQEVKYDSERLAVIDFYENELKRIKKLPDSVEHNAKNRELVNNLVIQILQCFTEPVGEDFVLCRQGGLQRRIWTYEALYALEALDEIGDFDDYIDPVIDLYFSKMQKESGEIVPLGIYWAMASSTVLYSFADHAMRKGYNYFLKYIEQAKRAFEFVRKTRASTKVAEGVMEGLYPPMQSCDCELVLQAWTFTDAMNVVGIRKFCEALKFFADPFAVQVEKEVNSYITVLNECFDRAKKLSNPHEGIRLTNFVPGMPGDETLFAFPPNAGLITHVLHTDNEDVSEILHDMKLRDRIHEGLYWRMPEHYYRHDEDGVVRMWYTTIEEYYWLKTFLRLGMSDKAQQIIDSTMKYSVTKEGYMLERYHQRDPYFCPWSPNASGNGRLILMLLEIDK